MTQVIVRLSRLVLMIACLAWLAPAQAQEAYGPQLVHLIVVDRDSGQQRQVYLHNRRYYVAGDTGRRYSLRLQNQSQERVLVVLSVDGVNVISGDTANYNGRGYILAPHQIADINGWRKSETEIAAFRFAPLRQSYAARTGRSGDVGVIGMAVFRERRPPPVIYESRRSDRAEAYPPPPPSPAPPPPPAPLAQGSLSGRGEADNDRAPPPPALRRAEKLGTAHGEIEHDVSRIAPFNKASSRPDAVRVVEYDSAQNLIAAGVIPSPEWHGEHHPRPFPDQPDRQGYAPDPPPYPR